MDFESPDVERDFPGLYASESGKRSQESDFSDESHDRPSKKDLLIGKRKDKKESKKDQGYAALEGESSPEEEVDVKSPSKSKKSKSFKFPTIKEKREKSREKDVKEKERDRDKDSEKEKEKKKESKSKLKLKDKKKIKHVEDAVENVDDLPVFGVSLTTAVERNHCHDGVAIPVILRDCIDHVQEYGLTVEGIYKVSGIKSKVQLLKKTYNRRENVNLVDFDAFTVASLFKLFLRELPEPLLTADLTSRFEDSAGIKELAAREETLSGLVNQLPHCNRTCLAWIMRHLENIAAHERQNKMGVNALATTLASTLQMSSRLAAAFVTHSKALFAEVKLVRYIPPLSTTCSDLPNSCETIAAELAKQESLLTQIHSEMNHGYTVRSDQLWEVQRFITQLKRKMKILGLERAPESSHHMQDDHQTLSNPASTTMNPAVAVSLSLGEVAVPGGISQSKPDCGSDADDTTSAFKLSKIKVEDEVDGSTTSKNVENLNLESDIEDNPEQNCLLAGSEDKSYHTYLELEQRELLFLVSNLHCRISQERESVEMLKAELLALQSCVSCEKSPFSVCSDVSAAGNSSEVHLDSKLHSEVEIKEQEELCRQSAQLLHDRSSLIQQILCEREACMHLRIELQILQSRGGKRLNLHNPVVNDLQ